MKMNSFPVLLLFAIALLADIPCMYAQDRSPLNLRPDVRIKSAKALREYKPAPDTVLIHVRLPRSFASTGVNRIDDESGSLMPIMERLSTLRSGGGDDSLRIVHIGDSHIRGHIFPETTGALLNRVFASVAYTDMGVNGATCLTFTHPDRIAAITELNPELLILSFGTNESHGKRYNSTIHYNQMDELIKLIRDRMPDVPILLTTPPGSYESFRVRRRQRTYAVNPRTVVAVETIRRYARDHQLAVWDMYNLVGGKNYACKNWQAAGLMRPDHVHFMPEGYVLQGELLFEALINAYNHYAVN